MCAGVRKKGYKWYTEISYNGRTVGVGGFDSALEAAQAYDVAAAELYENPIFNFGDDGGLNPDRKALRNRYR
jgi:hypothetical protein